jgi:GNAT superfamily N-acetyltransferase
MIVIRRAAPADAAELARMRFEFRTSLRPPAEDKLAFLERCTNWMADRLASEIWLCWIALSDSVLVGHLWLGIIEKLPNPGPEDELHGYITNFYVRPAVRKQGIGTQLLETALAYCRTHSIDSVILWPTDASRPLYERHGFAMAERVMLKITGSNAYKLSNPTESA